MAVGRLGNVRCRCSLILTKGSSASSPWHRATRALRRLPGKSVICVLIACALLVIQTPAFRDSRLAAAISALRSRREGRAPSGSARRAGAGRGWVLGGDLPAGG